MQNTDNISLHNLSADGEAPNRPDEQRSEQNSKASREGHTEEADTSPRSDEGTTATSNQHSGIRFHLAVATLCLGVFLTVLVSCAIGKAPLLK